MQRQILALGGGGFSMERYNPLLDLYLLKMSPAVCPRICFLPTASGDAETYVQRFYGSFRKYDCIPTHLSLFRGTTADLRSLLLGQNIIFVGGGNTRNMLALWRDWGVDKILREAYEQGIVLAGVSAGSLCWFESGVTDSVPGKLSALPCLGFLAGSHCPHYDGESERRPAYQRLLKNGELGAGLGLDDGAAAHFIEGKLQQIVSSIPQRYGHQVELIDQQVVETKLPTSYLGGQGLLLRRAALQDAPAIHDAHMRSIREVCSKDHTEDEIAGWGYRSYREEHRQNSIKNHFVWVVEERGKIEGYGHLKIEGEVGEIWGLYLTPEVLGKGLGRALTELIEEQAVWKGLKSLELESTLTALNFYLKQGFVIVGEEKKREINGSWVRCVPMRKNLR